MIEVKNVNNSFVTLFDRFANGRAPREHAWFSTTRQAAFDRFADLGFPTTRHEEWRSTNVARIARTDFCAPCDDGRDVPSDLFAAAGLGVDEHLLVFVDGRFSPEASLLESLPGGVIAKSLASAMADDSDELSAHLARYAAYDDHAFVALNTAFVEDGAYVRVAKGTVVERPIHLLYISTGGDNPVVVQPRNLIVVGDNSQLTIVETYIGLSDQPAFTNAVTEIVAGDSAVVDHYKIEQEGPACYHIATLQLYQSTRSNVTSHTISLGGILVRNDINALLDGEGCCSTLNGFTMIAGTQHVDNHLTIDHAKPHCDSREFFKNVLDGKSHGVFSGRIIVRVDAQKTDAKQSNKNLLLSDEAQVDSKPQLEILADDVKCTHGATIGQVDKEAIFYLQSRGMNAAAARSMLVFGFAREALAHIKIEPLRKRLERAVFERLPEGSLLEGAA